MAEQSKLHLRGKSAIFLNDYTDGKDLTQMTDYTDGKDLSLMLDFADFFISFCG